LIVALGDQQVPAQHAPVHDPSGRSRLPLIVSGADARFRLTGAPKEDGRYEGECLDPIHNRTGSWILQKVEMNGEIDREDGDLHTWITMVQELHKLEGSIEAVKHRYDSQKVQMENLSPYLVDDGSLRQKATSRLSNTSSALDEARADVEKVQAELDATIRNVELSQRISPKGRLAILSRESLQRESRWIEITLKLLAPETTPGFEEQLERAYRIKAVQDQIEAERRRMEELDTLDRYRGVGAETPNEEEFYRGLQ
jgi:chromosome segregation ATPase